MKSYDKSNTVFSMDYKLDHLYLEVWQNSPDDGNKVKYCILKRDFSYAAERETGCKYRMGDD